MTSAPDLDARASRAALATRAAFAAALRDHLARDPAAAAADVRAFHDGIRASGLRYAGEPLEAAFSPLVFDPTELAELARIDESALALLERTTDRFLDDPEMQAEYGIAPEHLALVRADPGYRLAIPCGRLDSHHDGRTLRFLEANTDGTSGMSNVERVTDLFLERAARAPDLAAFGLAPFALGRGVLDALLASYGEWRARAAATRAERPRTLAIVDWGEVETRTEFQDLKAFFEASGQPTAVCDPRELRYDGRTLALERDGRACPIDLVYRRVVTTEYRARLREVEALTRAYLDGRVCVVGSFRSDVAFDKRALVLLTDSRFADRLSPEERAIAAHFAATWTLRPGDAALIERALREREAFVLKPADQYAGRGVRLGALTEPAAWRRALVEAADGRHVLQERIPAPVAEVLADAPSPVPRPLHLSVGHFLFGGRLIGFLPRASRDLVLSAETDEKLLPALLATGRREPRTS